MLRLSADLSLGKHRSILNFQSSYMTFPLIPAQCPLALTGDDRNVHNCTQTLWPFHPRLAERQRSRADTHAKRVSKLRIAQSQGQSRRRLTTTAATPLNLLPLSRSATAQSLARDAVHGQAGAGHDPTAS